MATARGDGDDPISDPTNADRRRMIAQRRAIEHPKADYARAWRQQKVRTSERNLDDPLNELSRFKRALPESLRSYRRGRCT
jgi:ferric-dicitrate binding protein FerR (iron transport regulator)